MATKRLRGVSVYRPIIYGNTAVLIDASERGENDHTHRWTVGLRSATSPPVPSKNAADQIGGADDLSYFIKKVTFKLHETYSQPLRTIEKPPFEVTETGWGEFDIIIKIFFVAEAAEKPLTFTHHLKLHPWPLDLSTLPPPPDPNAPPTDPPTPAEPPAVVLSPVHSWQYEEIVFAEPTETFYATLLARPPAPLPRANRHPKTLVHALGGGGNFGEFSLEMEKEEGERMEEARRKALEEVEVMRKQLVEHEKELTVVVGVDSIRGPQAVAAYPGQLKAPFPRRKLILNAFDCIVPSHVVPGTWTGEKQGHRFDTIEYWQESAKLLERGKFHGIFIADSYGFHDTYHGDISVPLKAGFQVPKLDPFLIVSAMASVTKNLAFGLTSTTTYEAPYALARRFTTLDHFTNGRVGWNIVTSHLTSAARNFGLKEAVEHDRRYELADEYMDVVYKLWESSWHDKAVKRDQEKGIWTEPALVRKINHSSPGFPDIPGPFISHPSPQRTPALFQAGSSGAGTTFGAKHAEAVFVAQPNPKIVQLKVDEYRAKVAALGRDPRAIKVLPGLLIFLGETEEEAEEKYQYWRSKSDGEAALAFNASMTGTDWAQFAEDEEIVLPPGTGGHAFLENQKRLAPHVEKWTRAALREHLTLNRVGATVVGTPAQVADIMEEWVTIGDVDGFNLSWYSRNSTFEDIVNLLVPELQRRGLLWDDYPTVPQPEGSTEVIGLTAREGLLGKVGQRHLHPRHYGYSHKWLESEEEIKEKYYAGQKKA